MPPLLTINDLSLEFRSEEQINLALNHISFQLFSNEILALVGESGSGKSVTSLSVLQLLGTAAHYTSGQVLFHEKDGSTRDLLHTDAKTLQHIRGNKIAMIFQEPMTSLNPVLTCGEQVMEALLVHKKISRGLAKQKTIEWFEKVKLPNPPAVFSRYPHQLSGGQKQRVMIAMAMCCEPALLICDEPTTALDVTVQKTILDLIKELKEQTGMGVIFITHDLGVVADIADRAIVMYKGEIAEQGTTREIFLHPQHPYTRALIACRPVNHQRGERLPVVADFLEGKKPKQEEIRPVLNTIDNSCLLKVEDLYVHFGKQPSLFRKKQELVKAVDGVNFELFKGETLGLVGESGCGKTTLGRTILRLIEPTSGKILFRGQDLTQKKPEELYELRKELQIIFQDPYSSLNPRLSIGAAISEPMKVHGMIPTEKGRKEKVMELLKKVDLRPEHYNRYPHEFSGGQRQRIVIARALALDPSFIVCDESVSALDVSVQAQVLNMLNDLKKEFGFTVIFISHDLSVVRYFSDRILVMNKGKIVESGAADDIYFHPKQEYTKNLVASIPKGIISN
ncbi:MAG: ABC transporter ATP-binding protein [Chitinophagaceae bacterium]|nr:ABC transporter ATP-binding protein [Chitinophagaceae bacterium]